MNQRWTMTRREKKLFTGSSLWQGKVSAVFIYYCPFPAIHHPALLSAICKLHVPRVIDTVYELSDTFESAPGVTYTMGIGPRSSLTGWNMATKLFLNFQPDAVSYFCPNICTLLKQLKRCSNIPKFALFFF